MAINSHTDSPRTPNRIEASLSYSRKPTAGAFTPTKSSTASEAADVFQSVPSRAFAHIEDRILKMETWLTLDDRGLKLEEQTERRRRFNEEKDTLRAETEMQMEDLKRERTHRSKLWEEHEAKMRESKMRKSTTRGMKLDDLMRMFRKMGAEDTGDFSPELGGSVKEISDVSDYEALRREELWEEENSYDADNALGIMGF